MAEAADHEEIARHDVVLATVREFAVHSGSPRVAVVVDRGPDHVPPLIEHEPGSGLTVTLGEQTRAISPESLQGVPALPVPHPRLPPASAISVDAITGEVEGPIGALPAIADALGELARLIGGRSVAMIDVPVRDGQALTVAAREGEPIVLALGDQQWHMPG